MTDPQWNSWILEIRNRLSTPPPRRLPPTDTRQAAVLVPLYVDAGELWTILTQRTRKLPHHKGQIAFPGGSLERGEEPWEGAVRETEEEIGIESGRVLKLGDLDELETPSGFRIVPCVGVVPFPAETRPNEDEIDDIFAVPLSAFANPTMVEDQVVRLDGEERVLRVYHVGSRRVWGLTALVVQNLLQRLGLEAAEGPPN